MQKYIEWLKRKSYRANTIRSYLNSLEMFRTWYESATDHPFEPTSVTSIDINDWQYYLINEAKNKQGKPYAIATVLNYIEAIKTYFRFLYDTGQNEHNIGSEVKTQKVQKIRQPKWLDRREKALLLRYIDDPRLREKNVWRYYRNLGICLVMLMGGLRASEVVNLNITDLEDGFIFIRDGKGRKARMVPMNKDLSNVLSSWIIERDKEKGDSTALFLSQKGGRITVSTIRNLIEKIRKEAGLQNLTPHVLRHTFCYDLASRGVPDRQIADLAGHTDINTTRTYTTSKSEDYLKAVNLLSTGRYNQSDKQT